MFGADKKKIESSLGLRERLAERERVAREYEAQKREAAPRRLLREEESERERIPETTEISVEEGIGRENGALVGRISGKKKNVDGQARIGEVGTASASDVLRTKSEERALQEDQVCDRVREKMKSLFGRRIIEESGNEGFKEEMAKAIEDALKDEAQVVRTPRDRERMKERIYNLIMGYGPLEVLFSDKNISEIMVSRYDRIFIEEGGKMVLTDVKFASEKELRNVVDQIVSPIGRAINAAEPMVDGRLPDGSRVNVVIPPIAVDGTTVTIRRFPEKKLVPEDYLRFKSCDYRIMDFLRMVVEGKANLVVSGGTGSGKTSLLNLMSNFLSYDPGLSVVTIEDSCELRINHPNVRRFETRNANAEGKNEVTSRMLVKASMRQRPDVIIIGEIRDGTMADFLRVATSGHDGCMTTVHNNSPEELAGTIQVLFKMAEDYDFTETAINRLYASAVDVIVQIRRYKDHVRRISNISHVVGYGRAAAKQLGIMPGEPDYDRDEVYVRDIFTWRKTGVGPDGEFTGVFEPTGYVPKSLIEKFEMYGVSVDMNIFDKNYDWNGRYGRADV